MSVQTFHRCRVYQVHRRTRICSQPNAERASSSFLIAQPLGLSFGFHPLCMWPPTPLQPPQPDLCPGEWDEQWLTGAPPSHQTGGIRWLQLGLECSACGSRDQQEQTGMHLSLSHRSWAPGLRHSQQVGCPGSKKPWGSGLRSLAGPSVAVAAVAVGACLWCPRLQPQLVPPLELL